MRVNSVAEDGEPRVTSLWAAIAAKPVWGQLRSLSAATVDRSFSTVSNFETAG